MKNNILKSGALSSSKRDEGRQRSYEIFIDIGSYRTTVLCLPHGDRNDERDRLGNIESYLIPFEESDREFPASYLKIKGGIKLITDETIADVKAGKITYFKEKQIVDSAKRDFIHDFLNYPNGYYSENQPTNFVLYIKALLEHTFRVITCDHETVNIDGNLVNIDQHWRSAEIPRIEGIQVTVPDLYIENLRQGYCDYILEACKILCDQKEGKSWEILLEDYIKYEKSLIDNKNKSKLKQKAGGFVSISADESGAGELYFMESMKMLSSLRFNKVNLDRYSVSHIQNLFSQKEAKLLKEQDKNSQKIICCRIDIGGITTDAGVSLVEFFDKKYSEETNNKELRYKLLKKESFSQRVAGEEFKKEYEKNGEYEGNWWEDAGFIRNSNNCSFNKTMTRIAESQYNAVTRLSEENEIDAIYFVVSGRPTIAKVVQDALLKIILSCFNKKKLLLLKESCIFISNLPLVYHDWIGGNWHVDFQEELAKWVTAAVGEKMLLSSSKYEIGTQEFNYYIKVDHYPPIDGGDLQIIEGGKKEAISLEKFPDFKKEIEDSAVRVGLSFSAKENGEYISFLDVLNRSCQKQYTTDKGKCYPKLKVGSDKTPLSNKSWIIPSIYVEGLDKEIHELLWKG